MRKFLIGLGVVIVTPVALMLIVGALSPSTEVVTLTSIDAEGQDHETPLWVVEHDGSLWLRSGNPESRWLAYLRANPSVALERGEQTRRYRAVPVEQPATRERINELMAKKYGLSDSLVGVFGDTSSAVAIRLEPDTAVGSGPPE